MSGGSSTGSCASMSDQKSLEEDRSCSSSSSSAVHSASSSALVSQSAILEDDDFDAAIEECMERLEKNAVLSSAGEEEETEDGLVASKHDGSRRKSEASSSSGATTPSTEEETFNVPLTEADIDQKLALFNQNIQIRSPDSRIVNANHHVSFPIPPPLPLIRFDRYSGVVCRRRLSQCKEEENEEEESSVERGAVNAALLSLKKSSSLDAERGVFMPDDDNKENLNKEPVTMEAEESKENEQPMIEDRLAATDEVKAPLPSRFTVVKAEHKDPPKVASPSLRAGIEAMLRNSTAKQNSQTIHFPCSTPVQSNRMSVQTMFEPHLDKRFFDTSLVEIRSMNDSSQTVNEDASFSDSVDGGSTSNDIWVKRSEKKDDVVSELWG